MEHKKDRKRTGTRMNVLQGPLIYYTDAWVNQRLLRQIIVQKTALNICIAGRGIVLKSYDFVMTDAIG